MKKATLLTTLAVILAATSIASADLIHESTERYYENGTEVIVSTGGSNFIVGDISGDILWEVIQKGFWDLQNETTTITYTVGNDDFSEPITSFHAPLPMTPISYTTGAAGWDVEVFGDEIVWSTDDAQYGIPTFQTKNEMTVVFDGLYKVGWAPGVMVDFADGTLLSNDNWVVSAIVPAPGALLLGILGMGGIGWIKRRIS